MKDHQQPFRRFGHPLVDHEPDSQYNLNSRIVEEPHDFGVAAMIDNNFGQEECSTVFEGVPALDNRQFLS
jgi:hypothetical protein